MELLVVHGPHGNGQRTVLTGIPGQVLEYFRIDGGLRVIKIERRAVD